MQTLTNLAESVRKELNLEYDADSVKYLEGFIERNKATIPPNEWQGLINSCAAFVGECIIANYGGQWQQDENGYAVAFDSKNKMYPFSKVRKQFENGLEDSVHSFYTAIPMVFNIKHDRAPKKWWQLWK